MSIRTRFIILAAGLFLALDPLIATAGTLRIGEECPSFSESINNDSACISNDCEESNIPDPDRPGANKWFCDCNDDSDCDIYGPAESGDWDCEDGYDSGYDLDYCVDEVDTIIPKNHIKYPLKPSNDAFYDDLLATLINREVIQQKIISSIEDDINDKLAIRIPGLNFSKLTGMVDKDGYMYIPWLGEYIKAIYNYSLGIISIIAVIMIIMQGGRIIASGGGEGKQEGLKKIGHVVIGLVIAWSSYAILYTINPKLTEFKPLKIKYVEPKAIEEYEEDVTKGTMEADFVVVEGDNIYNYNRAFIGIDTAAKLQKVATELKKHNIVLSIASGYRSLEKQTELINLNCQNPPGSSKCNPKQGRPQTCILKDNNPANCPHTTGRAVDVWGMKEGKQCVRMAECNSNPALDRCRRNDCQAKVIEVMKKEGFCLLNLEAWHFETLPAMSTGCEK